MTSWKDVPDARIDRGASWLPSDIATDRAIAPGYQWLNLAEFQTHPSSHLCYHNLQVWKGSDQEQLIKSGDILFPIISICCFFFRRSRATDSAVGGPIRQKFKLVRALMHVIVTCKYEKKRMKNSRENVETPFLFHHNPIYSIIIHGNKRLDLADFQTHPSSHVCNHYL